jgi:hypothetical protein
MFTEFFFYLIPMRLRTSSRSLIVRLTTLTKTDDFAELSSRLNRTK